MFTTNKKKVQEHEVSFSHMQVHWFCLVGFEEQVYPWEKYGVYIGKN